MSITSDLFRAARFSATARAVAKGRVPQRAYNIVLGRLAGRVLGKLWR